MSLADPSDEEDVTNTVSDLPSIFVDEALLKSGNRIGDVTANQTTYKIDDTLFVDYEREDTGIVEFEVHAKRVDDKVDTRMDSNYDMYCSTPESDSEYEDDNPGNESLPTSIQEVPHGIILNSNVYLTSHQWNTLIFMDLNKVQCAVCELYCDLDTCSDHVDTERHKKNLDMHRPLERFDLSITRKIRDKLHCAVCNELFDASDNYDHYGSKMHEGNLLFAVNKASDVMYDYNIHEDNDKKIECYHFNENNRPNDYYNESSTNDDASNYSDYTNNDNYINYQNNYFYNDFDNDFCEEAPANIGASYATVAKKPKVHVQKFLDVDLGNKKVKVRHDSWHMIISPKLNRFYCMVCKKLDHMRLKSEHCSDVEHLKNLYKCKVVEAYEEYFIRQVDDKLYHCGHCNNLQLIHEMEDHVEINHPRKNKINDNTTFPAIPSPVKNISNENEEHELSNIAGPISPVIHNQNSGDGSPVQSYDKTEQRPQNNDRVGTPVKEYDKAKKNDACTPVSAPVKSYDKTIQRQQNNERVGTPLKDYDKTIQRPQNNDRVGTQVKDYNERVGTPLKDYDKTIQRPQNNDRVGTQVKDYNERVGTPLKDYDKTIQRPQNNDKVFTPVKYCDKAVQRPQNNDKIASPVKQHDKTIQRPVINDSRNTKNDSQFNNVAFNAVSVNDSNISNKAQMLTIFDNIVIFPFGCKQTLPILSYNIVCKRPTDFYCGLCDVICPENMIYRHLYEIRHIELLQRTPFIVPFSYNLIRAIREALHCAICNVPVTANKIYDHLRDTQHVKLLTKALGIVTSPIIIPVTTAVTAVPGVKAIALDVKAASDVTPNVAANVKISSTDTPHAVASKAVINDDDKVRNDNKKDFNDDKKDFNDNKIHLNDNKTDFTDNKRDFNDNKRDFTDNKRDFDDKDLNDEKFTTVQNKNDELDLNEDYYEELNETIDSVASEDVTFDMEEFVYLKLRNSYIKIANTSYNSLVHVGDGSRYCFVCALQVDFVDLQKHVDSRVHLENMEKYRFLDKYEDHLLRQIFLMYHCCICNVIITRKELKTHLEWPTHALQNENTLKNIKKTRKTEIKGGVKQIVVSTQKENIYLNEKEPKIKIHFNTEVTDKIDERTPQNNSLLSTTSEELSQDTSKKNKIVILYDNVLKISWESWNGVSKIKTGYKCNLCQRELKNNEIEVHCNGEWHRYALDKPFEKQYAPALIRKINDLTLNCLICNTEVSNKDHLVTEHINGKKHIKNYENILKDSSQANTYADCNDDVLML